MTQLAVILRAARYLDAQLCCQQALALDDSHDTLRTSWDFRASTSGNSIMRWNSCGLSGGYVARVAASRIWAKISVDAFGADAKSRHLLPRGRGCDDRDRRRQGQGDAACVRDEVDATDVRDQPSNDTPIAELAAMNARL